MAAPIAGTVGYPLEEIKPAYTFIIEATDAMRAAFEQMARAMNVPTTILISVHTYNRWRKVKQARKMVSRLKHKQ
jgi:hypothetical protein